MIFKAMKNNYLLQNQFKMFQRNKISQSPSHTKYVCAYICVGGDYVLNIGQNKMNSNSLFSITPLIFFLTHFSFPLPTLLSF